MYDWATSALLFVNTATFDGEGHGVYEKEVEEETCQGEARQRDVLLKN